MKLPQIPLVISIGIFSSLLTASFLTVREYYFGCPINRENVVEFVNRMYASGGMEKYLCGSSDLMESCARFRDANKKFGVVSNRLTLLSIQDNAPKSSSRYTVKVQTLRGNFVCLDSLNLQREGGILSFSTVCVIGGHDPDREKKFLRGIETDKK